MAIAYQKELDFTVQVLRRMRVGVHLLHPDDSLNVLDAGLRGVLGLHSEYADIYRVAPQWHHERTVYKVLDQFMCNYIYFHLPDVDSPTAAVIGPYLTQDLTREMLLEQTERLGLGMQLVQAQADFYASLPVFNDPTALLTLVTCLGEVIWGGTEAFHMVDVNYDQHHSIPGMHQNGTPIEQVDVLQQMKQLEERYAYENELMEIVSKGLTNRAELMMSGVSQLNFQSRSADPLRNVKNYCIICNTLLRKAAQNGGVHPIHLDNMSGQFARRIENIADPALGNQLIGEMIRAYCRLVRSHKGSHLSAIVQRARTYIDANLSGDLSLSVLSRMMNVTPGYLSALFHRETGTTLSSYITTQRLHAAMNLLSTTNLQIQSIAQLCGFSDPNYFSKQFKHSLGFTPLQYRREHFRHCQPGD